MATCVVLLPRAGCNDYFAITLLVCTMMAYGMSAGADLPLPSELSINFPATLLALINTVSASAGILAPSVVGFILKHMSHDIASGWALVFYLTAAICCISGIAFAMFGTAERQSWDRLHADDHVQKNLDDCHDSI